MKINKIRPIPKYMIERIRELDMQIYPRQDGHNRFYAYFTTNDKDLVKVSVAVKNYKGKWHIKQVAVHGLHSEICFVKDMMKYILGGYSVNWFYEGLGTCQAWYANGQWDWNYDKYLDPGGHLMNVDYIIKKFPQYKYSGVDLTTHYKLLEYLRLYEQYPQIEMLTKLGLHNISMSKQILKLVGKDKKFAKWLAKNRDEIRHKYYYTSSIIQAYKQNADIGEIDSFARRKKIFVSDYNIRHYHQEFKLDFNDDLKRLFAYLDKQQTSTQTYIDYIDACKYLELDITEERIRYPRDFKYWHDIRIDEYHTKKELRNAEAKRKYCEQFKQVAEKYMTLEYDKKSAYIVFIAHCPEDLKFEGEKLCHCVGQMNYDSKFAREESLIFFIRQRINPNMPYVTVEYSPQGKKILQCRGTHNAMPDTATLNFINKKWLPYANKQLKQITA